ncbi:serine hydrolase [Luteitalea sp. TBR-22]|uniref:serine hydrolase n=1 Tax=Luteitalea sp. TBR-22 TaxID=2802971 RepID=UPI001EF4A6DD|nr:serine hydrolase [Luteitalea sp. TBR-22]
MSCFERAQRRHLLTLLLALCVFPAGAFAQAPPADLDAWVTRAMTTFDVPGIAVAIVKDGTVVHAKGYGVRRLGDPAPVDDRTLFGIASNTKAFTAAAIGMLVDEGKVAWDDPVGKHLPGFSMADPYASREITVRDTLSHRSGLGLGAGDLLFWPDTDVSRDQVVAAARSIPPASSFRSRYAYNNLMFVVAGQVIASATGKSWDDVIRERIFVPLGMNDSRISNVGLTPADNVASPHSRGWRLEGRLKPIQATRDDTWAAAAGIKSNLQDMTRWMRVQLARGRIDETRQLFSPRVSDDMWQVTTPLRVSDPPGPLAATKANFAGYGLGWNLRDYRGRKIVSHTGGLTGMVTLVMLVPSEGLGIVVLTNQEEGGAFSAIGYHILDAYLGAPTTDWIAAYRQVRDDQLKKARDEEQKQAAARNRASRPSLSLDGYAGNYADAWYGGASLATESGRLVLRLSRTPAAVADLEHWQYDTFKAVFRDDTIPDALVTFALDETGKVDTMKLVPTSDLADFSFDYQDLLFGPVRPRK